MTVDAKDSESESRDEAPPVKISKVNETDIETTVRIFVSCGKP